MANVPIITIIDADTKPAEKSVAELQKDIKKALGSDLLKGSTTQVLKLASAMDKTAKQAEKLQSDLEKAKTVQLPTAEFAELSKGLEQAQKSYDKLSDKKVDLHIKLNDSEVYQQFNKLQKELASNQKLIDDALANGVKHSPAVDNAYKTVRMISKQIDSIYPEVEKLQQPIKAIDAQLQGEWNVLLGFRTELRELVETGEAFTVGNPEEISRLESQLSAVYDKQRMQLTQYDEMSAKQEALNQKIAEEQEAWKQNLVRMLEIKLNAGEIDSELGATVSRMQEIETELATINARQKELESAGAGLGFAEYDANLATIRQLESEYSVLSQQVTDYRNKQANANQTLREFAQNSEIRFNAGPMNAELQKVVNRLKEVQAEYARVQERQKALENAGRGLGYEEYDKNLRILAQMESEMDTLTGKVNEYRDAQRGVTKETEKTASGTQQLTKAFKQISSVGDRAFNVVRNSVKKLTDSIKHLHAHTERSGKSFGKLAFTIMKAMIGVRGLYALVRKLRAAVVEGFKNLTQESAEAQMSLTLLSNKFLQLKNSVGAAIAPLVSMVAPALTRIIDLFTRAFNAVAMFFGALSGGKKVQVAKSLGAGFSQDTGSGSSKKTGEDKYNEAVKKAQAKYEKDLAKYQEKVAKAEEKQAKAAGKLAKNQKEANKQLSNLDILNNLTSDSMEDYDDSVEDYLSGLEEPVLEMPNMDDFLDGVGAGIADMFEEVDIDPFFEDLANKVKKVFEDLAYPVKKAWDKMGGFVTESWKKTMNSVKNLGKDVWRDFIDVWKQDKTVAIFEDIFKIIGDIGLVISTVIEKIREAWNYNGTGKRILEAIRDIIGIIVGHIREAADFTVEWAKNLNFKPLFKAVKDWLESLEPVIDNVMGILQDFYEKVLLPLSQWGLEEGLPNLLQVFIDFNKKVDWEKLRGRLATLWEHLEPFMERVGEGLIIFLDRVANALADWVNSDSFESFLETLENWMDSVTAEDIANLAEKIAILVTAILGFKAIKTILAPLSSLFSILGGAGKVASGVGKLSSKLGKKLFSGLGSTWKSLGGLGGILTNDLGTVLAAGTPAEIGMTLGVGICGAAIAAVEGYKFGKKLGAAMFPEDAELYENYKFGDATKALIESWDEVWDYNALENTLYRFDKNLKGLQKSFRDGNDEAKQALQEQISIRTEQLRELGQSASMADDTIRKAMQDAGYTIEEINSIMGTELSSFASTLKDMLASGKYNIEDFNEAYLQRKYEEMGATEEAKNEIMQWAQIIREAGGDVGDLTWLTQEFGQSEEYVKVQSMGTEGAIRDMSAAMQNEAIAKAQATANEFNNLGNTMKETATTAGEAGIAVVDNYTDSAVTEMGLKDGEWKAIGAAGPEGLQEGAEEAGQETGNWFIDWCKNIIDKIKSVFQIASPSKVMRGIGSDIMLGMFDGFKTIGEKLKSWVSNFISSIKNAFTNIASSISSKVSSISSKLSSVASSASRLNISSYIGGKIRGYASGQVIPPSMQQHLAVLGDNKQETEVVSPLSTMKQAMIEALAESNFGGGSDRPIVVEIDGKQVFSVTRDYANDYKKRTGSYAFG